jgi:hypothetical protein
MSLLAGVKVISKFILNKGVKDAVKKFGKESVDKVMKSKTHKEMINNPPMTSGQKAVVGASAGTAAVGTAATGYGYKTTSDKMKEIKAEKKANGGMMNKGKKKGTEAENLKRIEEQQKAQAIRAEEASKAVKSYARKKARKMKDGGSVEGQRLTRTVPPQKGPNSQGMRGTGAAISGTKFKGVF